MAPGEFNPVLVLSPHCDDAVFACGQMLEANPGSVVAAGAPLTEWDRAALGLLGATPLWLDFRDSQYGPTHSAADLRDAIERVIRLVRPGAVFVPMGLFHSDHRSVHEAALQVAEARRHCRWFLYEDALYRRIPGLVAERLRRVTEAGFLLAPVSFPAPTPSKIKAEAVHCYRSQLRALSTQGRPGHEDALAPERYWACSAPGEKNGHAK